jgi:PadR family transcriptional regulator, regulatory protein AphA
MELPPTAYVILGMLRLGKRTGYDIKQLVDRSTRFFWAASYGQIYPELKRLEDAGLIRGSADPQGGRQRRAYELTREGDRALDEWLRDPDVSLVETRDLALLKLFFADGLPPADAAAIARAASERHAGIVAALEEVERWKRADAPQAEDSMTFEVLRFGLDFHRWCARRFARMEQTLSSTEEE